MARARAGAWAGAAARPRTRNVPSGVNNPIAWDRTCNMTSVLLPECVIPPLPLRLLEMYFCKMRTSLGSI